MIHTSSEVTFDLESTGGLDNHNLIPSGLLWPCWPMKRGVSTGVSLDEKDRLLLSILQSDAGLSLSEIGLKLGLTKMAVSNRIKNLKKAAILEGSHYRVNPQKVDRDYLTVTQVPCGMSGPE